MSYRRRVAGCAAVVALAFVPCARSAWAVQASGALIVEPGVLGFGPEAEFLLRISARNTSTATADEGAHPVPAVLQGDVRVTLSGRTDVIGCADLVPSGPGGCAASDPSVTECRLTAPDVVTLVLDADGVLLPAEQTVPLATVKLRVFDLATFGGALPFCRFNAATEPFGLSACQTGCALGGMLGASLVVPVLPSGQCSGCRYEVRFVGDAETPDKLIVTGRLEAASSFGPGNALLVELDSPGGEIFSFFLPRGSVTQEGANVLVYRDARAREVGGIGLVRMRLTESRTSFRLEAFSADLAERAAADMSSDIVFGSVQLLAEGPWTRTRTGWRLVTR
ncbi:MAG: hypothetical protein AB1689_09190 [Thermodesulfobacteriota bacterium]